MKVNKQETTEKWYSLLIFLENELKINNHKNISILLSKYKVCHRWGTFLIKKNIIYLENGYYRWNEKIPVSNKLINLYRKYQTEENKRNIKYKKQEPNLFNMPQSPLPKPPKIRKTRIDSKYLSVTDIIQIYGKSESTIRRIIDDAKQKDSVKEVPMKNGVKKIYISKDYLDSIFKTKIKTIYYDESKNKLGIIRKFLKWLW